MVHQHFTLVPSQTVTENILLGLDQPRFLLDARRSEAEVARLAARVRPAGPSPGEGLAAQRRRAAAGRDPEAALPRRPDPDPGRADRGPRPAGGRGPVPDAEVDDRGRPERRLHQPQAQRGRRDRGPDHGHAPRPGHGAGPAGGGRDEARPGPAHGRAGPLRAVRARRRSRRATVLLATTDVEAESDRGLPALRGVSLDVRAGEIVGIAAVAGNGQTELAEVITGLRRCSGTIRIGDEVVEQPAAARRDQGRRRPRPGGPDRRRQRAEPVGLRQPDHEAVQASRRCRAAG